MHLRFFRILSLAFALLTIDQSYGAVPKNLEPEYCDALIEYGQRNYPVAITKLDRLISTAASIPEFYEIKALILKNQQQPLAAEIVYRKLLEIKKDSPSEQAPYAYELGTILFQNKNYNEALPYFELAAKYNFNEAISWFYAGMSHFNLGEKAQALDSFENSISAPSVNEQIRTAANFYVAQIAAQIGYATAAYQGFEETKVSALKFPEMKELAESSKKAQDGFDRGVSYGSLGISTIYDSNVLSLPVTTTDLSGSGLDSIKTQLALSLGASTSPKNLIQVVGSYRFTGVYHTNAQTKTGEYMPHNVSLFLNYRPLNRISGGLKFSGMYMTQNNPPTDDKRFLYQPFEALGGVAPYVRLDFRRGLVMNIEWNYSLAHFYTDKTNLASSRRSGPTYQGRVTVERDLHHPWLNPSVSFSQLANDTVGTEFNAEAWSFNFSNQFYWGKDRLSGSFDFTDTTYARRTSGYREDFTKTLGLTWTHPLWPKTTLSADMRYTQNDSNVVDTAKFRRFVGTTTLTFSF